MGEFFRKISKSDIRNILAVIAVVGAFVVLYMLIVTPIPETNKDTVNLALGFVLGGLVGGVSGFYFGASKGETKESNTENK
jgi:hypothetical protein